MNEPWIYMCSPSRSPLPPPSPSHPSGSSQCTSPEHPSHASNLGWGSVSPLIVYLSQCCSLRTSHPRLLPQSPPTLLVGMQTSTATVENSVEISLKTGNRTAIWPSNPTPGHTHRGNQIWKRHVYPNVHCSTVYHSQDMTCF